MPGWLEKSRPLHNDAPVIARTKRIAGGRSDRRQFGNRRGGLVVLAAISLALLHGCTPRRALPPGAFAGESLRAGAAVRGSAGTYTLTIPEDGWRRLPAGSISQDTDLELGGNIRSLTVIVRVMPADELAMDRYVDARRVRVFEQEKGTTVPYRERRYLLDSERMIPASLVRYELHGSKDDILLVLTVVTEQSTIEVIGHTPTGSRESELQSLVTSLSLAHSGSKP